MGPLPVPHPSSPESALPSTSYKIPSSFSSCRYTNYKMAKIEDTVRGHIDKNMENTTTPKCVPPPGSAYPVYHNPNGTINRCPDKVLVIILGHPEDDADFFMVHMVSRRLRTLADIYRFRENCFRAMPRWLSALRRKCVGSCAGANITLFLTCRSLFLR